MSTRLTGLIPMLNCDDAQVSLEFYRDALGFEVVDRMDDAGKTGWASLRHGSVRLMLASPHFLPDGVKVDGRFPQLVLYFYPEDVAALHAHLRALGYATSELKERFYGMNEFEMLDPSGHVLTFGQSIPSSRRESQTDVSS